MSLKIGDRITVRDGQNLARKLPHGKCKGKIVRKLDLESNRGYFVEFSDGNIWVVHESEIIELDRIKIMFS